MGRRARGRRGGIVNRQALAESIVGEVEWTDPNKGFCRCPGADLHTNGNNPKDCIIYINGAPNVYCQHESCDAVTKETNKKLPFIFGEAERAQAGTIQRWQPSPAYLERKVKAERDEKMRKAAEERLPAILKEHALTYQELSRQSPTSLEGIDDRDIWRPLLQLFAPEDNVWIGGVYDSGEPHHARHFRPAGEWLTSPACPGSRIVPSTFKAGAFSRSKENIERHKFLVIDNDDLPINDQCAVLSYVRQWCRLRAVIFSGNKSLHGYFDIPEQGVLDRLELILPPWGIDSAGFNPAHPFRMAGCINEKSGRYSDLIYLDTEVHQ